jgi:hypothetical protein
VRIDSALTLPELTGRAESDSAAVDVVIELGPVPWAPPPGSYGDGYVCGDMDEAYIYVDGVGAFQIQAGRRIVIDPAPGVSEGRLRVFTLGGALGLLLHQRGLLVLHASAVLMAGGAVAFLGDSGEGKSTMAGAMHRAGYAVLADDMVAIDLAGERPALLPGFSRVKLWPAAAARMGYDPATLKEFDAEDERREWRASGVDDGGALPIHGLYFLESGRSLLLERLSMQASFAQLLHNSYAVGLLGVSGASARHFHQCARVAEGVGAFRLRRRRALAGLATVVARVTEHATGQAAANGAMT